MQILLISSVLFLFSVQVSAQTLIPLISDSEGVHMRVIPDYPPVVPKDTLQILTRYIGDPFLSDTTNSVMRSGVYTRGGITHMVINTIDLKNRGLYRHIRGGGPHIWISKEFSYPIRPWLSPNKGLVLEMLADVPTVDLTDSAGHAAHFGFSANQAPVTQLSFGFYLHDDSTGKVLAYIICVYESRGPYPESARNNDTFVNFVSTPLEANSSYCTKFPLSASLQSAPFSRLKFFRADITVANLQKAIQDANCGLSRHLANYRVTQIGILFELPNYVPHGSNVSAANVSGFSAYVIHN